jgi:hypothetical protein
MSPEQPVSPGADTGPSLTESEQSQNAQVAAQLQAFREASPAPAGPTLSESLEAHNQQVAAEVRAAAAKAARAEIRPSFEESLRAAHAQATQVAAEQGAEAAAAVESLTPREQALIFEAVKMAETAEADLNHKSGHLPEWLKTAAKSASIGAIGSIAIGVGENYAHSKGWHMLPADNSVGEAWFMLVNAYYTSKAWANRRVTSLKRGQ